MLITELPFEVQEILLSYLDAASLLKARRVCWLWSTITDRCIKEACVRDVPPRVLTELLADTQDFDTVLHLWLTGNIAEDSSPAVTVFKERVRNVTTCFEMHDNVAFVGDVVGNIMTVDDTGCLHSVNTNDGQVGKLASMKSQNLLLATGQKYVHFYDIQYSPECKISEMGCQTAVPVGDVKKLSIFGSLFAVSSDRHVLTVYSAKTVNSTVNISVKIKIQTEKPSYEWKLWGNDLICLYITGEVVIWDTNQDACTYKSRRYLEIAYQNPCWLYRDVIFCSTFTTRSLLEYWHMDRGATYWMFGSTGSNDKELHRHYIGQGIKIPSTGEMLAEDTVMCVALRRQLFVCGTRSGKLVIFTMKCDFQTVDLDFTKPSKIIVIGTDPVTEVDISFHDRQVYFLLLTTNSHVVQCVCCDSETY